MGCKDYQVHHIIFNREFFMYKSESRKSAFRVIFSMLLLFLIVCLTPQAVLAAKAPKKVTGLKASAASESVTLTWNPITSASGYLVYGKTGTEAFKWMKTLQGANRKKCTLTGLDDGKVYAFRVIAFVQNGGEKLKGPDSAIVKATPTTKKPGKPVLSAAFCFCLSLCPGMAAPACEGLPPAGGKRRF